MLKKYMRFSVILITLFSFCINYVSAYEYENPDNADRVTDLIIEIFDDKEQYEDLAGEEDTDTISIKNALNSSYWWPIGSEQTIETDGKIYATGAPYSTQITSYYGYRKDPANPQATSFHSGVDISGAGGDGFINVIAVKDGVVVYPTADVPNDCPFSSDPSDNCGGRGQAGNYVVIQHSDGNYTLYAHLTAHSITVTAGDAVEQGQVIGKMGSSGASTGVHLHFEVREGQNSYSSTVEPLNYISLENPRVVSSGGDFLAWLNSWEGHTKIEGDHYVVENIGDGVRTVGGGITLENNASKFLKYGINIDDYPVGSKIPKDIVDRMELEVINSKRNSIEGTLSKNSITLEENQIQALISQMYNIGNISGFVDNYNKYGNTDEFYNNWFFRAIKKGSKFEAGLTRRRNAEWTLFHIGEYVYNG